MTVIRFELHRDTDVTGVSGPGIVADGLRLSDGRAVVRWRGERSSTVLWADYAHAVAVHGHDGKTRFVDTCQVADAEVDGIVAAVGALQLAARMVFAGPCLDQHPDGVVCAEPQGHTDWPSLGAHCSADGGGWLVDHSKAAP